MSKNRKSKRNNNKRKRGGRANVGSDFRRLTSVVGIPIKKLIITQDTISSTNGTTALTITPSGAVYFNLSTYVTSTDWLAVYSGYQLFRIKAIKVVVSRLISENQLTAIYPNGIANLHVAYYPINASYSPAASFIVGADNSMRISPFTNRQFSRTFVIPNMMSTRTVGGIDYTTNPSQWTSTNLLSYISGCFCVASLSPAVAASTSNLFAFETYAEFEFAAPY